MDRKKDLLILAADKDAEKGLTSLLEQRTNRLGIRPITFECVVHPKHDGGVRSSPLTFLRGRLNDFEKALVIFDLEGSGARNQPVEEIERSLEETIAANGWQDRCCVVILVPELESWIWDDACSVRKTVRLSKTSREVRSLLEERGFLRKNEGKPARPKEAFEFLLREARTRRSSALYAELALVVDMTNCTDRAFIKFLDVLRSWFPNTA